jgi:hypothetical protein
MGAPDSPVHHRTLSGAPSRHPTVRVLTLSIVSSCGIGQSGATPDTVRCTSDLCSDFWHALFTRQSRPLRELAVALLVHRTVRCHTGKSDEL